MTFPDGFIWGAASASYQVEGSQLEDGKGDCVWNMMCRQDGRVWANHSGLRACDHYHRYAQDVAMMQEMGLQAYRFSVSWPRVLPQGEGNANPQGLDFYDRLVDALLAAGIRPFVTLFHWDYPYALYRKGGWLNSQSPNWFADYAAVVVDRLSDRVRDWMTLNEPTCFVWGGHSQGVHAPGDRLGLGEVLRVAHNVLLGHGKSVQVIRSRSRTPSSIGLAAGAVVRVPPGDDLQDVEAARLATFAIKEKTLFCNSWWLDPIYLGHYPQDGLALMEKDMPVVCGSDMAEISQPLDYLGLNIYTALAVTACEKEGFSILPSPAGHPATAIGWDVRPEAMYWGCKFFAERYAMPLMITENGMANVDWVSQDGEVHDPQRIDFTARYLKELHRAMNDGVNVSGYFHWSIMDNFEWADGYKHRFGLVHVDYGTQKRTFKDSAHWYRKLIETNGGSLA
jgi:beta-glucosidase